MALLDELEVQGNWLFRWRSYLPLMLIVLVAVALQQLHYPFGELWWHDVWEEFCLAVSFAGLTVRAITIGFTPARTSGRNTKSQIADSLNTTGIYSVVRHPLYLGNFLIGFGISLVPWVWWLPILYSLVFIVYYERIMFAEEAFLRNRFGHTFEAWASVTPAIWPQLSLWRRPELTFSLRNVLRREYTGLLVVILGHAGIELAEYELMPNYGWQTSWSVIAIGGVVAYFGLRTLKKHTTILDVPGR